LITLPRDYRVLSADAKLTPQSVEASYVHNGGALLCRGHAALLDCPQLEQILKEASFFAQANGNWRLADACEILLGNKQMPSEFQRPSGRPSNPSYRLPPDQCNEFNFPDTTPAALRTNPCEPVQAQPSLPGMKDYIGRYVGYSQVGSTNSMFPLKDICIPPENEAQEKAVRELRERVEALHARGRGAKITCDYANHCIVVTECELDEEHLNDTYFDEWGVTSFNENPK
jgi:hypothetical protein